MSKEIKCPICQGVSTLRYNENRTYMSHCHDINCFKLVTVTAPSEAVAEELFSKFEKGTIHLKLSIPKKIAEELLEGDKIKYPSYELLFNEDGEWSEELQEWMETTDKWWAIVDTYLAGKTLGVELVEVIDD